MVDVFSAECNDVTVDLTKKLHKEMEGKGVSPELWKRSIVHLGTIANGLMEPSEIDNTLAFAFQDVGEFVKYMSHAAMIKKYLPSADAVSITQYTPTDHALRFALDFAGYAKTIREFYFTITTKP